MQLGTRAVVLSAKNLEEHDRLVVLLTQDLGVVTAYAKGARRQKGTMGPISRSGRGLQHRGSW